MPRYKIVLPNNQWQQSLGVFHSRRQALCEALFWLGDEAANFTPLSVDELAERVKAISEEAGEPGVIEEMGEPEHV